MIGMEEFYTSFLAISKARGYENQRWWRGVNTLLLKIVHLQHLYLLLYSTLCCEGSSSIQSCCPTVEGAAGTLDVHVGNSTMLCFIAAVAVRWQHIVVALYYQHKVL